MALRLRFSSNFSNRFFFRVICVKTKICRNSLETRALCYSTREMYTISRQAWLFFPELYESLWGLLAILSYTMSFVLLKIVFVFLRWLNLCTTIRSNLKDHFFLFSLPIHETCNIRSSRKKVKINIFLPHTLSLFQKGISAYIYLIYTNIHTCMNRLLTTKKEIR